MTANIGFHGFFLKKSAVGVTPTGPTMVQKTPIRSSNSTGATTVSLPAVKAGSMLIVVVANYIAQNVPQDPTSVSGSVNGAFSKAVTQFAGGSNSIEIFYKVNAIAGAETISITPLIAGSENYFSGVACEFSAGLALDKIGNLAEVSAPGGTVTASGPNVQANMIVVAGASAQVGGNSGWVTSAGYTQLDVEQDADSYTGSISMFKFVSAIETSSAAIVANNTPIEACIATFTY